MLPLCIFDDGKATRLTRPKEAAVAAILPRRNKEHLRVAFSPISSA